MDPAIQQAIAQVKVVHNDTIVSRGTGFLVADDVLATALYVVAGPGQADVKPLDGEIHLTFPKHKTTAAIIPEARNVAADWILLKCATPSKIAPVPPGRLVRYQVTWESWAYPDANPAGRATSGTVKSLHATVKGAPALHSSCSVKKPRQAKGLVSRGFRDHRSWWVTMSWACFDRDCSTQTALPERRHRVRHARNRDSVGRRSRALETFPHSA